MSQSFDPPPYAPPSNPYLTDGLPEGGPPPGDGDPSKNALAIASFVIGIVCMIAWCLPCIGLPLSIAGIVTGIKGRPSAQRLLANVGIVLSALGLVGSVGNAVLGVLLQFGDF